MEIATEQVLELIERIYAASTDPSEFQSFLVRIAALLRSPVSSLILRDQELSLVQISSSVGLDPEYGKLYEEYYCQRNIWFPGGRPAHYNRVGTGSEVVQERDLVRSEYFNDYLDPQGLFHMTGVSVRPKDRLVLSFSALRGRAVGEFTAGELSALRQLVPHLQRVLMIRHRLEAAASIQAHSWQVIDSCAIPLVLVDSQKRIRGLSQAAEQILGEGDGLLIQGGKLRAAAVTVEKTLSSLIESCFRKTSITEAPGGCLVVDRPSEKRAFLVLIDLFPAQSSVLRPPLAAVSIRDPERSLRLPVDVIQQAFLFTPAESRLVVLLSQGWSLNEISDRLEVTRHTVRSQLKNIFVKTGTRRQGELISLIWRTIGLMTTARIETPS